jgi:hypothetical protein
MSIQPSLGFAGVWRATSGHDAQALALVDGSAVGAPPHYSRRSPGSRSFTGIGREIVLVHKTGRAVWSVVLQRTPAPKGTGKSRGREGPTPQGRWLWRNNVFRNEGAGLSSTLIAEATEATHVLWARKYGTVPEARMRTEVRISAVKSTNPGFCYLAAGWVRAPCQRKGYRYFWEPER